jgi:hypothetical protein
LQISASPAGSHPPPFLDYSDQFSAHLEDNNDQRIVTRGLFRFSGTWRSISCSPFLAVYLILRHFKVIIIPVLPYSSFFSSKDPCFDLFCDRGEVCNRTNDGRTAECVCRPSCPPHRHHVCGSDRRLYVNHCELHRMACREKRVITVESLDVCIAAYFR